jgi:predicted enzyme involved in methoxymalonyl-ACP biosynthesis
MVSVSDRLADYGMSGILAGRNEAEALVVEILSLSCTVLGKQVEHALLSGLAQIARVHRLQKVVFVFRPSGRNQPALSFLKSTTDAVTENQYNLRTDAIEARILQAAIAPNEWKLEVRAPKIASRDDSF